MIVLPITKERKKSMSYSTILTIESNGDVVPHTEIHNGTLAMTIWNHISKEYGLRILFGEKPEIWSWCGQGKLKRHHDIVMAFTFDHVIVYKKDIPKLIEAFNEFMLECPTENMKTQIETLTKIQEEDIIGVAWQQTSVSDSLWTTNPMDDVDSEDYDVDLDISIPYNIYEGDKHWDLFEELKLK